MHEVIAVGTGYSFFFIYPLAHDVTRSHVFMSDPPMIQSYQGQEKEGEEECAHENEEEEKRKTPSSVVTESRSRKSLYVLRERFVFPRSAECANASQPN